MPDELKSRPEKNYARPECPEPARWCAPDGIACEEAVSVFLGALVPLVKPDVVLETGTYLGHTAKTIGQALKAEGRGELVSLERYKDAANRARVRCEGLPVTIHQAQSLEWEPPEGMTFDMIFLDSGYDDRIEECRKFKSLASPRCVLVSHDTVVPTFRAKLEQLAADGVTTRWIYLPTPRGLGIARYAV